MISNPKVVITDYDYGDLEIEKAILHGVGAEVIPRQAKCEEDLYSKLLRIVLASHGLKYTFTNTVL